MATLKRYLLTWLLLTVSATPLLVQAQGKQDCFVITNDGRKIPGRALSADDNGNLILDVDGKLKMPFKAGQYKMGYVQKPKEVAALEQLFTEKKYDQVISQAPAIFDKYKFLGWCNVIASLEADALLVDNKIAAAKKVLIAANRLTGEQRELLEGSMVKIYIAEKDYDKAESVLKRQMVNADEAKAAQAFCLFAEMAEAKGDKKQAILEYLKVLMLFENNKKVEDSRNYAKSRATKLMRELNDPRVDKIAAYQ